MFNAARIAERAETGEYLETITWEQPVHSSSTEPPGTLSQMVAYKRASDGKLVAKAHRYLRPGRTVGGSKRPDPKWLWSNGTIYLPEAPDRPPRR